MASRAAAAAIVARIVVRARQREQRIEKPRFLQSEKHGIGSQQSAKPSLAKLVVGTPRFLLAIRIADFALLSGAALKHAQDISRLRNFPAFQRSKFWDNAFQPGFVRSRSRYRMNRLGLSID